MKGSQSLAGVLVLLLEDSYYIAVEAQQTLEQAGARVLGPCRDLAEVVEATERERPDCALIDINLGYGPTFEPARAMVAAGVPIILMTGYDAAIIPQDLKQAPSLQKPVTATQLVSAVASASDR